MPSHPTILHENLPRLEVADSVLLDILLADTQARRLILTRLSDRVAIIALVGCPGLVHGRWVSNSPVSAVSASRKTRTALRG